MEDYIEEINQILKEFYIKNGKDYLNKTPDELSEIYENMKVVQEGFNLSDCTMEEILESILGKFEE